MLSSKRVAFVKKHYVMNNMNRARFPQKRTDRRTDLAGTENCILKAYRSGAGPIKTRNLN